MINIIWAREKHVCANSIVLQGDNEKKTEYSQETLKYQNTCLTPIRFIATAFYKTKHNGKKIKIMH